MPQLSSHLSLLLRIMYNFMVPTNENVLPYQELALISHLPFDQQQTLIAQDWMKHKEVVCNSISKIIILLLKMFKAQGLRQKLLFIFLRKA